MSIEVSGIALVKQASFAQQFRRRMAAEVLTESLVSY